MRPYGFRPRAWDFDGADRPVAVVDKKRARRDAKRLCDPATSHYDTVRARELDSAPEPDESVKTQEKS